ncbi:MAG: biotin--[acetyl-CoA-carboxylase] ligase [Aliarcobacter skirrowii]|nr:biotin--[acetyl-CoA-carboxylase] ligase [Aliarcobacter skirrowii]
MKFIRLKTVNSTQLYLKDYVSKNGYKEPICVVTDIQTNGIGSRGNSWQGAIGNLFFSFALNKNDLPNDLPLQSASIYFTYILKELFAQKGSRVFLKWPNDFYIENKKIGGAITSTTKDLLFCGIGINLKEPNSDFGKLDIKIDIEELLNEYFENISKKIEWKEIFSLFKVEFSHSKKFQATIDGIKVSLENAILNGDGSIQINDKKVFSLR